MKRILIVLIALALLLGACATLDEDGNIVGEECGRKYRISWSTGGYGAESGGFYVKTFRTLSNGGLAGTDSQCNQYYIHGGKAVIRVTEIN